MRWLLLLTLISCMSEAQPTMRIATFHGYNNHNVIAIEKLRAAYTAIGFHMLIVPMPAKRSLAAAARGDIVDSELYRLGDVTTEHPTLVRVPYPLLKIEMTVFSKDQNVRVDGWGSLRPYKIAFMRGFSTKPANDAGLDMMQVTTVTSGFKMVQAGRADLTIAGLVFGKNITNRLGLHNIKPLSPPLTVNWAFHYINEKHKHLIPALVDALQKTDAKLVAEEEEK